MGIASARSGPGVDAVNTWVALAGIASRCGAGVRLKDEGRAVDRRVGMCEDMCVGSAWAL